jgi:hypothetical protein
MLVTSMMKKHLILFIVFMSQNGEYTIYVCYTALSPYQGVAYDGFFKKKRHCWII